jgi:flavin-dependent dehydrogenase
MFDVCVAGGGPAGATTACYLSRKGYKVALADQNSRPRARGIESLALPAIHFLRSNGFAAILEAAAICQPTATVISWRDRLECLSAREKPSLVINRSAFDEAMLQRAAAEGVRLFRSTRVLRPVPDASGWIVPFEKDISIQARYFVDATGRASPLARNRRRLSTSTAALYAIWPACEREMRVEARPNCWLWGAPADFGVYAIVAFFDARQCAGLGVGGRRALYETAVRGAELFRSSVGEHSLGSVEICDATPYVDLQPITENALKVGDASLALDPVSSQGLQVALRSAWHASVVIHTILSRHDKDTAAAFYIASQRGIVEHHKRLSQTFYRQHVRYAQEDFWRLRVAVAEREDVPATFAANCPVRLSQNTIISPVPAIDGDLIVRVQGIRHPNLDRPIAYLNGYPAAPLLQMAADPCMLDILAERWQLRTGMHNVAPAMKLLLERQVLVPVSQNDG